MSVPSAKRTVPAESGGKKKCSSNAPAGPPVAANSEAEQFPLCTVERTRSLRVVDVFYFPHKADTTDGSLSKSVGRLTWERAFSPGSK